MISGGYIELKTPEEIEWAHTSLAGNWQHSDMASKQRVLADTELEKWKAGGTCLPFDVFCAALLPVITPTERLSLLEVGCGSGFYWEVIQARYGYSFDYTGVDYSEAMIDLASERYSHIDEAVRPQFDVADAAQLPCKDRSYDVVVSGCCLLHMPRWKQAIVETARVSKRWVMLHRTPVTLDGPTRWYTKIAYDVRCVEAKFGFAELSSTWSDAGLVLHSKFVLDNRADDKVITYLLERHQ